MPSSSRRRSRAGTRGALAPFVGRRLMRPLVGRFFHLPNGADLEEYRVIARAHPTFELRPRT
jgi:hypothetical protein